MNKKQTIFDSKLLKGHFGALIGFLIVILLYLLFIKFLVFIAAVLFDKQLSFIKVLISTTIIIVILVLASLFDRKKMQKTVQKLLDTGHFEKIAPGVNVLSPKFNDKILVVFKEDNKTVKIDFPPFSNISFEIIKSDSLQEKLCLKGLGSKRNREKIVKCKYSISPKYLAEEDNPQNVLGLIEETLRFFTFKKIVNDGEYMFISFEGIQFNPKEDIRFKDFENKLYNYILFMQDFLNLKNNQGEKK
jgi:c-di-AMP phosphodiesterase-like protein